MGETTRDVAQQAGTASGEEFDAIVLGAGEAGSLIASRAVADGHRVAMVYKAPYGSTCLNTGCVPSKFMIHRARVAHLARTAARYHVKTSAPEVDLAALVAEKNAMLSEHRDGSYENARTAEGLTLLEGDARFLSPREVAIGERVLRSERIFIATGMRPLVPHIDGLDAVDGLTNESLMELRDIPRRLVCIGGGYIACELGQAFRRYGSEVAIIQSADHLCPSEEPDVSTLLERAFDEEGIRLLLGHRAVRVERTVSGVRVTARADGGGEETVDGTHLLVAVGRQPNTDGLGLEAAGVATDEKGYVTVNSRLETNVPGIWAAGDVNGQQPFTRVCQEEAKLAFANAFEGAALEMRREFLGHAVFTDPAIGSVGLTEREARAQGHDVAAGLVTFDQIEKAEIIGETTGLIKYVVERGTRRLLGCHVIGPDGADLIYDAIIVMRHAGTIDELALAVGIFPTLQEGMEGTARGVLRKIAPERLTGPLVTASIGSDAAGGSDAEETPPAPPAPGDARHAATRALNRAADFEASGRVDDAAAAARAERPHAGPTPGTFAR
jgi:pyruvate/2-oxoglutarate dehydrogenase complex dihydrolipoamide dehydrogenase (E3) component